VNEQAPASICTHRQTQDHRQLVAHAPAVPRVSHRSQHRAPG
jgi:hypothetical protein